MKTLHLTLKKGWFDMIASGEKKEEYREIKPYWIRRFISFESPQEFKGENKLDAENIVFDLDNGHEWKDLLVRYCAKTKQYQTIEFRNGYSKNARTMTVEWMGLSVGQPSFKWFGRKTEENEIIFIVHLGQILSKNF